MLLTLETPLTSLHTFNKELDEGWMGTVVVFMETVWMTIDW